MDGKIIVNRRRVGEIQQMLTSWFFLSSLASCQLCKNIYLLFCGKEPGTNDINGGPHIKVVTMQQFNPIEK